jgi:hypothetical protein
MGFPLPEDHAMSMKGNTFKLGNVSSTLSERGVPFQPELAMGAVVDGGAPSVVRNEDVIQIANIDEGTFNAICDNELAEIERRRPQYLGTRERVEIAGRNVSNSGKLDRVVRNQEFGLTIGWRACVCSITRTGRDAQPKLLTLR